jgi:hypothetical protein
LTEPLAPLTGEDDKWIDLTEFGCPPCYQNLRYGAVFKDADQFNGQAYDVHGRVFRLPSGACYTNQDSKVLVTFPYTPKTEYVNVDE